MSKDLASNRKARFSYEILETFEAGIALLGTEIKSLRQGGGSIQESYVKVDDDELFLINAYIAPYKFAAAQNHNEKRARKLLMHKQEILKLKKATLEKGLSIIPLALFLKKGFVKVKIALAKGKKIHDKRASKKEQEEKRNIQKLLKS